MRRRPRLNGMLLQATILLLSGHALADHIDCIAPTSTSTLLQCGLYNFNRLVLPEHADYQTSSPDGRFTYYFQPWSGMVGVITLLMRGLIIVYAGHTASVSD